MSVFRKVAHYMITYYLPSSLFVVVSWASFLIPSDDIQATFTFWQIVIFIVSLQGRMALLITLFLVLVNIFNAITTNSPKADGLNALQAWVIACIFFIFGKDPSQWSNTSVRHILGALFEYSVILLRMKIKTIRQIRKCLNGNLAAYLAPLANPLSTNVAVSNGISRQTQGTNNEPNRIWNLICQETNTVLVICTRAQWETRGTLIHFEIMMKNLGSKYELL